MNCWKKRQIFLKNSKSAGRRANFLEEKDPEDESARFAGYTRIQN